MLNVVYTAVWRNWQMLQLYILVGEEPRIGSSPIAAYYMGWITNGELGETANFSVLLIEYSGQNRIIPPCIFTLLLAVALKLCRKQLVR